MQPDAAAGTQPAAGAEAERGAAGQPELVPEPAGDSVPAGEQPAPLEASPGRAKEESAAAEASSKRADEHAAAAEALPQPAGERPPVSKANPSGPLPRRVIIVAGMHRSGTSAITRVLALLGADLPNMLGRAAEDNEPGFWEPLEIVQAHDKLLGDTGSAWDDVSPLDPRWFESSAAHAFDDQLRALLERNYGESPLFVVKDPRICRLIPLWLRVLDRLEVTPSFVITVRNPLEVAASLRQRDGFTLQKSQLLWLRHVLEAERWTRSHARTWVSYERLLLDWMPVVAQIAADLDLGWTRMNHNARVEVDRFLSSGYRHHAFGDDDLAANSRVVPSVRRVYSIVTRAAEGNRSIIVDSKLTLDGIYRELGEADRVYGPLLAEARITAQEEAEVLKQLAADDVLRIREEVAQRERALAHQGEQVHTLTAKAARLEAALADLREESERGAVDREEAIERLEAELSAREGEVARLQDELAARNAEVERLGDALVGSRSEVERVGEDLVASQIEIERLGYELGTSKSEVLRLGEDLAASQSEIERLEHELGTSQSDVVRVVDELAERQGELERLTEELAERDHALAATGEQLQTVAAELVDAQAELDESREAVSRLQGELAASQTMVADRAHAGQVLSERVAYLEGQLSEAQTLLVKVGEDLDRAAEGEQHSREEQIVTAEALRAREDQLARATAEVEQLRAEVSGLDRELDSRLRRLEEMQRDAAENELRLRNELAARNQALASTEEQLASLSERVAEQEAELSRQAKALRAAEREASLARVQLEARARLGMQHHVRALGHAIVTPFISAKSAVARWGRVTVWLTSAQTRSMARAYLALRKADAFDRDFYLANYRDVARSGMDPLRHYVQYGVRDRYNPSRGFSTEAYLTAHPELLETGENPLLHALRSGEPVIAPALPPGPSEDELLEEAGVMPEPPPPPRAPVSAHIAATRETASANGPVAHVGSEEASTLGIGNIPRGAIVLLAGGGHDREELANHRVWSVDLGSERFVGDPDGAWCQEIDALRAKGATYLVIVGEARKTLEESEELRRYLDGRYKCTQQNSDVAVYNLSGQRSQVRQRRPRLGPGWSGMDLICLPIIDWNYRFQRPQQLMTQFARRGHRVFYVATTLQRDSRRPVISELAKNVWGVRLPGRPDVNIYTGRADGELVEAILAGLGSLRQQARIDRAMSVVDLPFWGPIAIDARNRWGWKVVYDCMDEHGGFVAPEEEGGDELRDMIDVQERSLLTSSDLVIATSKLLYEKVTSIAERVVLVPNATDFEHFSTAARGPLPPSTPRPIIGYYGAISSWFDSKMIAHAARERPDWSFVLAGRTTGADLEPLEGLQNVHMLGELPYEEVPALLHQFDVACIPFHLIDLTLATNPVKFYEYMSAGKPVVSVELPELEPYEGYFYPARSNDEFITQVERALDEDGPEVRHRRVELGRTNTWDDRYRTLETAMRSWYQKAAIIIPSYNNTHYLRRCLDSLRDKTGYPNFDVIVVDNGSDQSLVDEVAARSEHEQNLKLIAAGENLGFARATNVGIDAAAAADFIVLLNDDTVVTPGWLGRLMAHLDDETIGMIGPVTNWTGNEARIEVPYSDDLGGLDEFAARRAEEYQGQVFDIAVLAMYCVVIRKTLIDQVGRLDERFKIGMFEDDDFAMRVREAGLRVVCAEDVFVHHWGRASFKRMTQQEYDALFEENKRMYEEIWNRPWVPHRARTP